MASKEAHKTLRRIGEGFAHGFAQIGSLGGSKRSMPTPAPSIRDALRSDWTKVGNDLRVTIDKAHRREKGK